MRRAVTVLAVVAAEVWSLLAWGAYAALGWAGGLVSANADLVGGDPYLVVWLSWFADLATNVGLVGVVIVWVIGLGVIALGPLLARLFTERRSSAGPGFSRDRLDARMTGRPGMPGRSGDDLARLASDVIRRLSSRR